MNLRSLLSSSLLPLVAGCGPGLAIDNGSISEVNSSVEIVESPVADGSLLTVKVTFRTSYGNPVAGATPSLSFAGFRNTLNQTCTASDADGVSLCAGAVASTVAEEKTLSVASPVSLSSRRRWRRPTARATERKTSSVCRATSMKR